MLREFNVEANVGAPQVAYRETIRKPANKVEGKFVRQSGGKGQYGHVVIDLEPNEAGSGFEFVSKIVGGLFLRNISARWRMASEKPVNQALSRDIR